MMSFFRTGKIVLVLLAGLLLFSMVPVKPVEAANYPLSTGDARITAAVNFIRNSEPDHPALWGGGEKTCYAIVALNACGADPHTFLKSNGKSMVDIIRDEVNIYCSPDPYSSLAHEYYLMAVVAAGENPWDFGGVNLVQQLLDMFDGTQLGQSGIVNDDFWGIISLVGVGVSPSSPEIQTIKNFIIANQQANGSWGSNVGGGGMGSSGDPCDTANAIMALMAAGESPSSSAIQQGLAYLQSMQNDDGGFPYVEGTGASDVASDARIIAAIQATGGNPTGPQWTVNENNPFDHALTLQRDDGGFAWNAAGSTDAWMTTYIMPALVGKYWPTRKTADNAAPSFSGTTPADGSTVANLMPEISCAFSDGISGVNVATLAITLDANAITEQSSVTDSGFTYTPSDNLTEGDHVVSISLSDKAGNTGSSSWIFTIDLTPESETPEQNSGSAYTPPVDTTPPVISGIYPSDGANISGLLPVISANYSDASSGIRTNSVELTVNGEEVTEDADITETSVSYQPSTNLPSGPVSVGLSLRDNSNNPVSLSWGFTIEENTADEPDDEQVDTSEVSSTDEEPPVIDDSTTTEAESEDVTETVSQNDPAASAVQEAVSRLSEEIKTKDSGTLEGLLDDSSALIVALSLDSRDSMKQLQIPEETVIIYPDEVESPELSMTTDTDPPDAAEGFCRIGTACEFGPNGTTFGAPVTITFRYDEVANNEMIRWDANGDGNLDFLDRDIIVNPEDFRIAWFDTESARWIELPSTVDTETRTVQAQTDHFTLFSLITPQTEPLEIEAVQVTPVGVEIGDEITITVKAVNPGTGSGRYVIPMKIDGYLETSQEITLEPGSHDIVFTHTEPYSGVHTISIFEETVEFEVTETAVERNEWWNSVDIVFYLYIIIGLLCILVIIGIILAVKLNQVVKK